MYQWNGQFKHGNKEANRRYKRIYKDLIHGRSRRKRGNKKETRDVILFRVPIEQRPAIVQERIRPGYIEVDFMMGKNQKGVLLLLKDRATLHTRLHKLKSRHSDAVAKALIKKLCNSLHSLHMVTFDNDKSFAIHMDVACVLYVKTYFIRPYTSQDKGSVENRIGQQRRFFPKKTYLDLVSSYQEKSRTIVY